MQGQPVGVEAMMGLLTMEPRALQPMPEAEEVIIQPLRW